MDYNITDVFLDNLIEFSKRELTEEGLLHARKCVLDYIGVTLAGAKEYHDEEKLLMKTMMARGGDMTIIGHERSASLPVAALINGISSHAVELDDGQRFGNIHPGSPVISALLSVGEAYDLRIDDLWRGVLVGYECVLRMACSIQPSHKLKGFHATGPCGTIGAAMGIAIMLNYNRNQIKSAFSAACSSSSGILEMIEGDTQMMPFNAGKAAMSGVVSAAIGKAGLKYPDNALGGKRGFLNCFSNDPNLSLLTDFSGKPYYNTNYFKLYAACGHCHAGIDAALNLRNQHLFSIDEIERITVETYKLALQGHDHNIIDGINSAKMSIPYSVAVALMKGSAGINDYNEDTIQNKELLRLTSLVNVEEDEEISKQAPKKRISVVHAYTKDNHYSERIEYPKGQPENPLTLSDIENKFHEMCSFSGLTKNKAKSISDMILNTQKTSMICDLMKNLKQS